MTGVPADLLMMLLADARFPVAGHTQSAGLEAAVQHGMTGAEVPLYLAARLSSTVRIEAGTAVVALHHSSHGLPLEPVARAWAARTPSPGARLAPRAARCCGSPAGSGRTRPRSTGWPRWQERHARSSWAPSPRHSG